MGLTAIEILNIAALNDQNPLHYTHKEHLDALALAETAMKSFGQYEKAFALACRFMADNIAECPAACDKELDWPECNSENEQCGDREQYECWQKYFKEIVAGERVCKVCGCTNDNACKGGCSWVTADLCSHCADKKEGHNAEQKTL